MLTVENTIIIIIIFPVLFRPFSFKLVQRISSLKLFVVIEKLKNSLFKVNYLFLSEIFYVQQQQKQSKAKQNKTKKNKTRQEWNIEKETNIKMRKTEHQKGV